MTGEYFYPPPQPAGSNAIGEFVIGTSPIGDIAPVTQFDWQQTVISQYANSTRLMTIIENMAECLDETANMDQFYDLVWNVDTAVGWGLDVWGRIVGVSRVLQISTVSYFGMLGPSGSSGDPYDVSPFYAGSALTSNYTLSDDAYRTLILAKALANICDGSIPAINQVLLYLFPGLGDCYVTDGEDMTMTYTFTFALDPVQTAIVESSGVLPKPVGVTATVVTPP